MTISVVQSAPSSTFTGAVAVNNTAFLVLGFFSALPETVTAIKLGTTTVTGTTQLVFPQDAGGGSPQGVLIAMLPNVQVSGQTVVNYTTGGSVIAAAVVEVAGLGASPTMDQSITGHGASASIASGTTGATTSVAEFVLAAAASYTGTSSAPSQGYWTMGVSNALLGVGGHLTVGYDIQSASGQTYAFNQATSGSAGWAAGVVTITGTAATGPSITTASLAGGTTGAGYSQTVAATGGTTPYAWSISAGSLPAGLSLAAGTGVISGTPTTGGTSSFTVKVTDAASLTATQPLSIAITSNLTVTTTSMPGSEVGVTGYSQALAASGGSGAYTWSISTGSLPAGLSLSAGVVSGTPTTAGTSSFTVLVTDAGSNTASKPLSIVVVADPTVVTASLPNGVIGTAYSDTLAVSGGTSPFTWTVISGSLPASLSLSSAGVISGTPTVLGTSSFTVRVSDADSKTASQALTLTIGAAPTFDVPPVAPSFPAAFLNTMVEIQLNNVWTDISGDVYQGTTNIGRGHPDESTTASPSTFTATLNNSDGRYSQLYPAGPYYPYLGLNTPVRVSVPEGASYLRLENDSSSYAQGPTSTGFSTGVDVQIDLTPDNWFAPQILAGQYVSAGNERSWLFIISGGILQFGVSNNGTGTAYCFAPVFSANAAGGLIQVNPHQRMSVRAVYLVSAGTVTFYYGTYCAGWTAVATVPLAFGVPFASTAPIQLGNCPVNDLPTAVIVGDGAYQGFQGKIHAAIVQTPAGGVIANPDFTGLTPYVSSFTDAAGNTWSPGGTAEISARKYRFHGYVAAWPQSWSPGSANALTSLSAGGSLRRMGSAQTATNSPMYRAYNRGIGTSQNLAGYWPMEDAMAATQIASGMGGKAMQFTGVPTLSSDGSFLGSLALPVCNNAQFLAKIPAQAVWSSNSVRWIMQVPATGDTANSQVACITTTGTAGTIVVSYNAGAVTATTSSSAGSVVLASMNPGGTYNGALMAVQVDVVPSGSNITITLSTLLAGATTAATVSGTVAGSVGGVSQVQLNPGGLLVGTSFGHLAVYSVYDPITNIAGALGGWEFEPAGLRFQRLCGEENIPFRGMGVMTDTVLMGVQSEETVAALLQECADADRGMWFEPRQCLGFAYRNRVSVGNQAPWVTFDYNQDHLSGDLLPTHDDQVIKNDVTVSNQGDGSSAEWTLNDGSPLSIGVIGRYDTSYTINLAADNQLDDETNWILHSLTVNEPRYTAINVDLANSLASFAALYYLILDAEIGDRTTISNPPVWVPPGKIDQIIQGANEVVSLKDLTESWNGVPSTPFNVMYLDDSVYGVGDTDGSSLAVAEPTGTATSLTVATTNPLSPLWTVSAADFPLNILVGGEVMTVTNITGSSSPQVFTVVRSVNGVVKAQTVGSDVRLAIQPTLSL